MKFATLNAADAMRNVCLTVRINVTGARALSIRIKLGTALLRLAARVIGCKLKVDLE